jgi:hypothetical protein
LAKYLILLNPKAARIIKTETDNLPNGCVAMGAKGVNRRTTMPDPIKAPIKILIFISFCFSKIFVKSSRKRSKEKFKNQMTSKYMATLNSFP